MLTAAVICKQINTSVYVLCRLQKVHPRGDLKGLQEDLGTEVLPEEYGGTNGKLQEHIGNVAQKKGKEQKRKVTRADDFAPSTLDDMKREFEKREKFFTEQGKLKSNEQKRRGLPKTHSDIFGVGGSFRQLDFD